MVTITIDDVRNTLARRSTPGAAVLIPLLSTDAGLEVLLEQRALDLDIQPGEVCLPGGHVESGESPQQAAVRETCEELLVPAKSVHIIGDLGQQPGPGAFAPYELPLVAGDHGDLHGTSAAGEEDLYGICTEAGHSAGQDGLRIQ